MNKLQDKVVVITGANSGIGLATAKLFLENGAKVVLSGRRAEALAEATKELKGDFINFVGDVSNDEDNIKLIKVAIEAYGKIDVLYLNAGVAPVSQATDITAVHYKEVFDINVKAPILTVKEALPYMNDGGSILNCVNFRHYDY